VIVVGGEPATGRSLEALLQVAGYDAWFQPEPLTDGLGGLLADSHLLLIAPALSVESRKALIDTAMGSALKIPVLELLPANKGEHDIQHDIQGVGVTPWPCSVEELQQRIRAALLVQA
jgi:hypothetical protein